MNIFQTIIQQIFNAATVGSLYAESAIGLAMVFSILGLVNFAHGDILLLGVYGMVLAQGAGLPFWLSVIIAILVSCIAGLLLERIAYRPLRGSPDISLFLTSFAATIIIENLIVMLISSSAKAVSTPKWLSSFIEVGSMRFPLIDVIVILTAIITFSAVLYLITRTRIGVAMRATSADMLGAKLCGINIDIVVVFAFGLGSAIAGLAGIGWTGRLGSVDPFLGLYPVLKGYIACVFGGFGNLAGALLGAYVLGGMEVLLQAFLPGDLGLYRDTIVFVLLVIMLLLRPQGLLGSKSAERQSQ
jgi:branched-chain amino acid transport system permease protein